MLVILTLRKADRKDFDTIRGFIQSLESSVFEKETLEKAFIENLFNPYNIYLIAEKAGKAVGYVNCHAQRLLHHAGKLIGEIQEMYVSPDYQHAGVGKELIGELKRRAKDKGITQLEVTANVVRHQAHQFYEREGFKNTHRKFTLEL